MTDQRAPSNSPGTAVPIAPQAAMRYLPAVCWVFAFAVAAHRAWAWRDVMTIDGVGYLDMADAFRGGIWADVVNGVWSPLYSAILGAGLSVLQPFPLSEFQAVHIINVALFVAELIAYECLLREAFATQAKFHKELNTKGLPAWLWFATARVLFVWATATMLPTSLITPDLLASAVMFASIGLLLRIGREGASIRIAALFGAGLGVGYLAKAILFPLAFIFLGMLLVASRHAASRIRPLAAAAGVFALISAPYVEALSTARGHLTFSDAGTLNYAWHVNGLPPIHWQGGPEGSGTPVHPTRKLFSNPDIYEFGGPVGGSVPVWYDPSYWYQGVKLRFDLADQTDAIAEATRAYWRIFAVSLGGFPILLALSLLLARQRQAVPRLFIAQWILLIPVAAVLAAYALVHVESRYVAPFSLLFAIAVLGAVVVPPWGQQRRTLIALAASWLTVLTLKSAYSGFTGPPTDVTRLVALSNEVAAEVAKQGLHKGDEVAALTSSPGPWFRQAGLRITAHAQWWLGGVEEQFWALTPRQRMQLYEKFGSLGITGVVLETERDLTEDPDWRPLGNTKHYWRLVARP